MPYQGRIPAKYPDTNYKYTLEQGSASSPTLSFLNDSNNGLWSPAIDNIAISTSGVERLRINDLLFDVKTDASINSLTIGRGKNSVASNTALGDHALHTNTTGAANTAVGLNTLYYVSTGSNNTAVGNKALQQTTGGNNTAVGASALFTNNVGGDNTAVGYYALLYNQSGSNNTAIGRYSLVSNTTGSKNIGIGYTAGDAITTGSNNTIIGDIPGTATLSDTVIIGAGTSEKLRIDSGGNVGIGTTNPTTTLQVWGNGTFGNTTTRGRVSLLQTNGNSNAYIECSANNALVLDGHGGVLLQNAAGSTLTTVDSTSGIQFVTWNRPIYFDGYGGFGGDVIMRDVLNSAEIFHAYLGDGTGGTSRKVTFPNGNVGIGTTTPSDKLSVNGYITESTDSGTTYWNVVTQQDIGTAPNQVPLNQYLGTLAYQDSDNLSITGNVAAYG